MRIKSIAAAAAAALAGLVFLTDAARAQSWNSELGCGRIVDVGMFMIDYSGSMSKEVEFKDRTKIDLALELSERLVADIPRDAGLAVGLSTFAPQTMPLRPAVLNVEQYREGIEKVPRRLEVFGRMTNLGEGLMGYEHRVEALKTSEDAAERAAAEALFGKNALIIVTDGGRSNRGRTLEDVCEHFDSALPDTKPVLVSFAATDEEKAEIERLTQVMQARLYDGRELLASPGARRLFIERELYRPCPEMNFDLSADALFAFDSAVLSELGEQTLAKVAETMSSSAAYIRAHNVTFSISAHTDRIGTESYNLELSDRRLKAVLEALAKNGVDLDLFTVRRAEGESRPVTGKACRQSDRDALIECLQPDRRVEIRRNR